MSEAPADAAAVARHLREAARDGDVAAQYLLGQMHLEGRGVALDPQEGLHWYQLAASAGHALAMNMVGRCHELGRGTPVNLELAAAWYRRAAECGLDWGQYNYAQLLAKGRGVPEDRARALALYRLAAGQGHAKSMNLIGRHYDEGWLVERDPAAARDWYRRAAEGGDFRGQCSYASVLALAGEIDEAVAWLRKAAQTATPAFLDQLKASLAGSPIASLRALGATLPDGAAAVG